MHLTCLYRTIDTPDRGMLLLSPSSFPILEASAWGVHTTGTFFTAWPFHEYTVGSMFNYTGKAIRNFMAQRVLSIRRSIMAWIAVFYSPQNPFSVPFEKMKRLAASSLAVIVL